MAACEVCNNHYDKSFEIVVGDRHYVFDCFECAIHALAPTCERCGCRVIGHGVESSGTIFCGAHCAQEAGESGLRDRA